MIHAWPIDLLTPKHPAFWPDGGVRAGVASLSGLQQYDALDGGPLWRARLIDIPIYCVERVLAAQAIQSLAMAGVGLFNVPRVTASRSPGGGPYETVPHSDGTPFSDGSEYASSGITSSVLAIAAPLYASVITIDLVATRALLGGEEFSIYYGDLGARMHRIMRVLEVVDSVSTVEISPPLREDTAAGVVLDFDRPQVVMRMTNAPTFLQALEWNRWADVTAEFEEAFF